MFKQENTQFEENYQLILNLMLAIHPKKVVEKHFATNQIKWQQINKMIGYKKRERQSLSLVEMDRGSPVCKKLHLQVVE